MSETRDRTRSRVRTRTATRTEIARGIDAGVLDRDQELVLRMRHGIAAPAEMALTQRGQDHPELAAKLALIEASALEHMRPQQPIPADTEGAALKQAIIDHLREI